MQICPYCKKHNDLQTQVGGEKKVIPKAGDVTICIRCGEPAIFNEDLTVRKPTQQEIVNLALHHPDLMITIQKAKQLIQLRHQLN